MSATEPTRQATLLVLCAPPPPPTPLPQGFYVVPEFHFDQAGLQNNATLFANEWRRFWRDFVRLPTYSASLSGRVFPELANEWDKFGCRWNTTTTGGWRWSGPVVCVE
jgi:hypothetical protein